MPGSPVAATGFAPARADQRQDIRSSPHIPKVIVPVLAYAPEARPPKLAVMVRIRGPVRLGVEVDETGIVASAKVQSGHPFLVAAAPSPSWQQRTLASAAPFIDRANDDWTRAIVSGDADVLSAPYAADGMFIGPDGSVIRSKQAVHKMYASRRGAVTVLKASLHSDGRATDPMKARTICSTGSGVCRSSN